MVRNKRPVGTSEEKGISSQYQVFILLRHDLKAVETKVNPHSFLHNYLVMVESLIECAFNREIEIIFKVCSL